METRGSIRTWNGITIEAIIREKISVQNFHLPLRTMTKAAIEETERRRGIQEAHNEAHGITPKTIEKAVRDVIAISRAVASDELTMERQAEEMSAKELKEAIEKVKKKMERAAADLNFEAAAEYRDRLIEMKNMLRDAEGK